jgi:hypothetical protein
MRVWNPDLSILVPPEYHHHLAYHIVDWQSDVRDIFDSEKATLRLFR